MGVWTNESKLEYRDNIISIETNRSSKKQFVSDSSPQYIDETYINNKKKNVTVRKWRVKIV